MSTLDYDYKYDVIVERIRKLDARNVVLQFPEGLKSDAVSVARFIEDNVSGVNVMIDADPCFGACDLADLKVNRHVDLVVHFAHTALPIRVDCPVVFVEASSSADVVAPVMDALGRVDDSTGSIGLVTTAQHLHRLDEMIECIEGEGYSVKLAEGIGTAPGQVLGCNFTSIKNLDVDTIIYVGSGDFHALGVKLFTQKRVILADPFTGKSRTIDEFHDRIIRIRFARITRAKDAKSFGIIMSSKKGQLRFDLAVKLKELIRDHGFDAYILNMDYVSPDLLLPYDFDAYVMTACPRIAIDDSAMYKKPVITPQELEIVLGIRDWEDYQMDEIVIHDEQL